MHWFRLSYRPKTIGITVSEWVIFPLFSAGINSHTACHWLFMLIRCQSQKSQERTRCLGSQKCGSRFVNFACKFHTGWTMRVRITLKSTTYGAPCAVRMREPWNYHDNGASDLWTFNGVLCKTAKITQYTAMWIGWLESNFRNPTVTFWAIWMIILRELLKKYKVLYTALSGQNSARICDTTREQLSIDFVHRFSKLFSWISIVRLIKFINACTIIKA